MSNINPLPTQNKSFKDKINDWLNYEYDMPIEKIIRLDKPKFTTLQLTPDASARNWRTEEIAKAIADLFRLPIDRVNKDGYTIRYRIQETASFEMVFKSGEVLFYFSVPENVAPLFMRRLQSVWPDSTIEVADGYTFDLKAEKTVIYELLYTKHDLYSLHTDAKDNLPLGSLLEAGRLLEKFDEARVSAHFEPIHQATWKSDLNDAWDKLRGGKAPQKWDNSARNIAMILLVGVNTVFKEVVGGVAEVFGGNDQNIYTHRPVDPAATKMAIDGLKEPTKQKRNKPGLKTYLWVAAQTDNLVKSDIVAQTMAGAFGDLTGDNDLKGRPVKNKKKKNAIMEAMGSKEIPKINLPKNIMSTAEAAKLMQIPGKELQEKYEEIKAINAKQVEVDTELLRGGLYVGDVTYRGMIYPITQPINKNDFDEVCLPTVAIGGMGQGKTEGLGANKIYEAVINGFGGMAIDPAKHQIGEELARVLPPDKIEIYNLSNILFGLDWCEVKHAKNGGRGMLADAVLSFFDDNADETGAQTSRFLTAAVYGMKTGKLSEIVDIFEDAAYLKEVIKEMPETIHKKTLIQFSKETEGRQRQILSPIYNRLNVILGDDWLSQCMDCENSIDMVEILQKRKAIIFDVAKMDGLTPKQIDIIVNLLTTKISLAMQLRPEANQFPFVIVYDEPHQFLRSARLWENLAVESRKWRINFTWLFHDWAQLPRNLRDIIKSALPHYHIYPSSKGTFADLKEEIYPFVVEDGLRLKKYHAINIIRTKNGVAKPVIALMAKPPSMRVNQEAPA